RALHDMADEYRGHGEDRHGDDQPRNADEGPHDEHAGDGEYRRQRDTVLHDARHDEVRLRHVHGDAKQDDGDDPDPITRLDDEQGGQQRGHEGPEEGHDGDEPGEDPEREPAGNVQRPQPERGQRGEDHHGEQLAHHPGAQGRARAASRCWILVRACGSPEISACVWSMTGGTSSAPMPTTAATVATTALARPIQRFTPKRRSSRSVMAERYTAHSTAMNTRSSTSTTRTMNQM